jgi:hypothetical protein
LKIVDGEVSYYDIIPTRTNLPKHDLAPLEFFIQGHDNSLINSRDIQLAITFYISGKKGTVDPDFKKLPQDHHLVPINGFLYTVSVLVYRIEDLPAEDSGTFSDVRRNRSLFQQRAYRSYMAHVSVSSLQESAFQHVASGKRLHAEK